MFSKTVSKTHLNQIAKMELKLIKENVMKDVEEFTKVTIVLIFFGKPNRKLINKV